MAVQEIGLGKIEHNDFHGVGQSRR
jgi:hypothetical protein